MDMLEILAEASESSNVAYNDFLLFYKTGRSMVYGFVEGKDDPSFYRGFIEAALPERWGCKLIKAGNKKRVLEVYSGMDWTRFPRNAVCFFVDRDLSEFLEGEIPTSKNVFISDGYSIENDIVTAHTLKRVLDEEQCVGGLEVSEEQLLERMFEDNLSNFKESMACVMAQILILRRAEAKGDNLVARLDNFKAKEFFELTAAVFVCGLLT